MVRDPYGNYVVQKILDIADDRQQEALCTYLRYVGLMYVCVFMCVC